MHTWFRCGSLKEIGSLENLEVLEIAILKRILKKWDEGVLFGFNWAHLIRNTEKWRAFMIAIMNCLFRKMGGFSEFPKNHHLLKKQYLPWN
jgi:hypothetical protein